MKELIRNILHNPLIVLGIAIATFAIAAIDQQIMGAMTHAQLSIVGKIFITICYIAFGWLFVRFGLVAVVNKILRWWDKIDGYDE